MCKHITLYKEMQIGVKIYELSLQKPVSINCNTTKFKRKR
jgi:hypothetical protein